MNLNPSLVSPRWWLPRLVVFVLVAASLLVDAEGLLVVPLLFVFVVPFEKLFPRHRGQKVRRPELGTDLTYAAASPALGVASVAVAIVVGAVSLAWLPGLALRPFVASLPPLAATLLAVLLFDFAVYWVHRWAHEVPALWRFHAVHHSTKTMDWISGLRNHPLDGAIIAPPFFFLLAAGFDPTLTGALAVIQLISGLFVHANVRWRLRPLHRVIITPEFHHWHHANEVDAHSSNYSVFLPLWDILFGTYHMPRNIRPMRYGVDDPLPNDMIGQLVAPFIGGPTVRMIVSHPVRSAGRGVRWTRRLLRAIGRSTVRPRRRQLAAGEPWRWTATPPQVPSEPSAEHELVSC